MINLNAGNEYIGDNVASRIKSTNFKIKWMDRRHNPCFLVFEENEEHTNYFDVSFEDGILR